MVDKVLGIIRETLLHENTVEGLSFNPTAGEVVLSLLQPDERYQYPDHELVLTFSGVRSLSIGRSGGEVGGAEVLGIECVNEGGLYVAKVSIGETGSAAWELQMAFTGLRYDRSPGILEGFYEPAEVKPPLTEKPSD
jgi:hypothetical protein